MKQIHQGDFRVVVTMHRGTVLFALMADWCPACRVMRKDLLELEARFPEVKFIEADADKSTGLINELGGVEKLPLILIYRDGKQIHANEGTVGQDVLAQKLAQDVLASPRRL